MHRPLCHLRGVGLHVLQARARQGLVKAMWVPANALEPLATEHYICMYTLYDFDSYPRALSGGRCPSLCMLWLEHPIHDIVIECLCNSSTATEYSYRVHAKPYALPVRVTTHDSRVHRVSTHSRSSGGKHATWLHLDDSAIVAYYAYTMRRDANKQYKS